MMHTIDERTVATQTVRVVFDGPPFAGKTTAAHALSELLGRRVVTPEEDEGRTLWFDWVAYDAGHHGGRPIRVELVTVPGQHELADRRRHLLGWGDVVVFVANTSQAVFNDSIAAFRELRQELTSRPETPIVTIANKRDLIDAVPMDHVLEQLGLSTEDTVIEGVAVNGGGIREAFVHAVHAALQRNDHRFDVSSPEALLGELQSAGRVPITAQPARTEPAIHAAPTADPVTEPAIHVAPTADPVTEPAIHAAPTADPVATAPAEPSEAPPFVGLHRPRLNPDAIADGEAVVILAEHWRVLAEVAESPTTTPLPSSHDPAEAMTVAELVAWGLLVDDHPTAAHHGGDITTRF